MRREQGARVEASELTPSEREWLRVREYLRENRYALAASAADEYPSGMRLADTPLLTTSVWIPGRPLPVAEIDLEFAPDAPFHGITGTDNGAASVLPTRADGTRYGRYSAAVGALAAPQVFENRSTYRLVDADLSGPRGRLVFGRGNYFDSTDIGEAAAHEYAAGQLGYPIPQRLRERIGNPCDPQRRPINLAISTVTIRHDPASGQATFFLHWRDPSKVEHAGGLYQVVPVGIFQPSGEAQWNERNDFSLWRNTVREIAEELAGTSEDHGSEHAPIDYQGWPFSARLTDGLAGGEVQAYCLGLGVDPLTFATDLLTAVVIHAPLFDELFGTPGQANAEGQVLAAKTFDVDTVNRVAYREPIQAAGAALLVRAWHSHVLAAG